MFGSRIFKLRFSCDKAAVRVSGVSAFLGMQVTMQPVGPVRYPSSEPQFKKHACSKNVFRETIFIHYWENLVSVTEKFKKERHPGYSIGRSAPHLEMMDIMRPRTCATCV